MIKAILGIVSLLVVLAIVGLLAKSQLQAVNTMPRALQVPAQAAPGAVDGIASDPIGLTVSEQSRQMQEQIREQMTRALQQGAERNEQADPPSR
ncbi:MAG: hypothetical protein ABJA61_00790 [Caldimonas sp.]